MKNFDCKQCAVSARQSMTLTRFFKNLVRRGTAQSAVAIVRSHRMAAARVPTPGSTWDHLVTFILPEGREVELHTLEVQYDAIQDGETGLLRWEGENLLSFEPEV